MENMLFELEHTQNFCDNSQFKHIIINNNQNKSQHWKTSRTHPQVMQVTSCDGKNILHYQAKTYMLQSTSTKLKILFRGTEFCAARLVML